MYTVSMSDVCRGQKRGLRLGLDLQFWVLATKTGSFYKSNM